MKRLTLFVCLLLAGCSQVNLPTGRGGTGVDDSNTIYSLSNVNPSSGSYGGQQYPSQLYTSLSSEQAGRDVEHGIGNFVYTGDNPNSCLGVTGTGLVMIPGGNVQDPCIGYNAGFRSTCGVTSGDCPSGNSITFPNASSIWVAMDENTSGNNAGIPNFVRVNGTHYLTDVIDPPNTTCSGLPGPCMASDTQLLMLVTTSGGSITSVTDLRNVAPSFQTGQLIGNAHNGSNIIREFSVNDIKNAAAYGLVSGLTDTTTGTILNASLGQITLTSSTHWKAGYGIGIPGAGPTPSLTAPSAPTVSAHLGDWQADSAFQTGMLIKPTTNNAGSFVYVATYAGSCTTAHTAPSFCQGSNGCTTVDNTCVTWTRTDADAPATTSYTLSALDGKCGYTAASSAGTASLPPAVGMSQWTYANLTIPIANQPTLAFAVYRGGALINIVPATESTNSDQNLHIRDTGGALSVTSPCVSSTSPASAQLDALFTTISAGPSVNVWNLGASATTAVSGATVYHDDTFAIINAIAMLSAVTGGVIELPPITFTQSQVIPLGSIGGGLVEPVLRSSGSAPPTLQGTAMMAGLPSILSINNYRAQFNNINIQSASGAPELACLELLVNNPSLAAGYIGDTYAEKLDCTIGQNPLNGIVTAAGFNYDELDSENTFRDNDIVATNTGIFIGHQNSLQNRIFGGEITAGDVLRFQGGSAAVDGTVFGGTAWQVSLGQGTYLHHIDIANMRTEANGAFLRVDPSANGFSGELSVRFNHPDLSLGDTHNTPNIIDNESSNISVKFDRTNIGEGLFFNAWLSNGPFLLDSGRVNSVSIHGSGLFQVTNTDFEGVGTPVDDLSGSWCGWGNLIFRAQNGTTYLNQACIANQLTLGGSSSGTGAITEDSTAAHTVVSNAIINGSAPTTITNSTGTLIASAIDSTLIPTVNAKQVTSTTAASISGGGSLTTGSNSFAGGFTGLAATSNVLTPGFTCATDVVCAFQDNTTAGGIKKTAVSQTTITFSATASDAGDYVCGCR